VPEQAQNAEEKMMVKRTGLGRRCTPENQSGGTAAKRRIGSAMYRLQPVRQRDLAAMAAQSITADELDDVIFSWILDREAELSEMMEAGLAMEHELDVVRALLRLILSPNVRMPLSRLQ
jgi:hypothetical protein